MSAPNALSLAAGLVILCGALTGCATSAPGKLYFVKPSAFPVSAQATPDSSGGSVFPTDTTGSLYGNQRNWAVGDIVTIDVTLNTTANDTDSGALAKSSSVNDSVSAFLGAPLHFGSLNGTPFQPTFNIANKQAFSGNGATSGSNAVTTEIAAVVTGIESNGILALAGRTNVNINGNVTGVEVTGFARPQDIGANNTLNSAQLADANVQYVGVGAINSSHHVPWLENTLSRYSPF
jgi:flagellar L-ring protein precursor FlgH